MSFKLNREQQRAVDHKGGPLLIIAGAGTGKTTVVTERIKKLILSGAAKPSEILALTFTEKAAREMENRVDVGLPYGYTQMWISTFHSFCDRILRAEALHIGLDPAFKLTTTAESIQFLRTNLFKLELDYFAPLGNPTKFVSALLQHFSRLQDEDIDPAHYFAWVRSKSKGKKSDIEKEELKKWKELAAAYRIYAELKTKNSLMDFGDLIVNTVKLFRERKSVLKKYQDQFKYILVDEYQDTNIAQNELVKLLAGKRANITVVADDDQSIYKWRGAAVSNVIQFRKSFPKTKVITLTTNYRSTKVILDSAYALIQFNNPDRLEVVEKINKKLKSVVKQRGETIEFIHADRVENEAESIGKIITQLKEEGNNYSDFAILVRANNHADAFVRALSRAGIPHQFLGSGKLFNQPEVADLVSYLRVLVDPDDSASFYKLLAMDSLEIDQGDLLRLTNVAKKNSETLFETLGNKRTMSALSSTTQKEVKKILDSIKSHLKLAKTQTAGQSLYDFLEEMELLPQLLNPDTALAQRRAANIAKLFDKLKTYEVDHEDASAASVVDWIDLATEAGESPLANDTDWTEVDAVNILTIHSAKGLEFPVVFLVNLVDQRFPTRERPETIPIPEDLIKEILPKGDAHLQEERRLFYVGITRAKKRLYFTAANYYGEGKREKKLSPFIFEALGENAVGSEVEKSNQLSFSGFEQPIANSQQPMADLHIDFLSYSQIQTFDICPLHYKLRYILKIPTPTTSALSFGTSIHATMEDFYAQVAEGIAPTNALMKKLLVKNWIEEGYDSKSHKQKMFARGVEYLGGYLKKGFNANTKVFLTEQPFVVPLYLSQNPSQKSRLKIGGKIDRVDDLGRGQIEIVDYKTSETVPTQREVDKDLQLTFYALAATKIRETHFGKKPEEVKLSLYFFKTQEKISTTRTAEQLEKAETEIFAWRDKIEKSDFTCSGGYLCQVCEYMLFCGTGV